MANSNRPSSGNHIQTILMVLLLAVVIGGFYWYYKNQPGSSTVIVNPVAPPLPHLIGGCAGTRYGCCPDGRTARNDIRGSNC